MKKTEKNRMPVDLMYNLPIIEFTGNRRVSVEGSTGVLQYGDEIVRLNTRCMTLCFRGRGLSLKCISPTCVVIEGYITETEFAG